ncbi:hypothetical protein B5566_02570 [Mycobacterium sp. MHSD3]|nr:hypothetical protein B5566_02570 [Mycobacterium sp. MHSD3]
MRGQPPVTDNPAAFDFNAWVNGTHKPPTAAPAPDIDFLAGTSIDAYTARAITEECQAVAQAPEGQRNDQLNTSAFNLASLVAAGRADRQHVTDQLAAAARACGLDESEILPSINSGFRGSSQKVGARIVPELEAVATAFTIDPAADTEHEKTPPEQADGVGTTNATGPGERRTAPDLTDLEQDFWTQRESLRQIYEAALTRMCAPWAVLAHCTARALALVPPRIVLPPIIGGPGSLNWFAAVATISGGGKGAASAIGRALIPAPVVTRNLGSGEGVIGAYRPTQAEDENHEHHNAVMFLADEIDTVTALGARTGSTMMGVLRSGFSGETLGFSYIARGRNTHLEAHTYRMTLVISVQPSRGGALLGDHGGGTPQRFMWFPGTDPRIAVAHACDEFAPLPLTLPPASAWIEDQTLKIPGEARAYILDTRARAARGELDALDGHAVFCREKFAFALAVLDGRTSMTAQDWELSGIAAEVSTATREWVTDEAARAADDDATERGRIQGVFASAADDEKSYRADRRVQRLARWVLDKVETQGPMTPGELRKAAAGRDRRWIDTALQALGAASLVSIGDDKKVVKT